MDRLKGTGYTRGTDTRSPEEKNAYATVDLHLWCRGCVVEKHLILVDTPTAPRPKARGAVHLTRWLSKRHMMEDEATLTADCGRDRNMHQ